MSRGSVDQTPCTDSASRSRAAVLSTCSFRNDSTVCPSQACRCSLVQGRSTSIVRASSSMRSTARSYSATPGAPTGPASRKGRTTPSDHSSRCDPLS